MDTYRIVRKYADSARSYEIVIQGLTLRQAIAYCNDPETSSSTCTSEVGRERTREKGAWFDVYYIEG